MKCQICDEGRVYRCPHCLKPIEVHTHENDYLCKDHGFVDPVRDDGVTLSGDGRPGHLTIIHP